MTSVSPQNALRYELRILFGPMFGVDLLLPAHEEIFVVTGNDGRAEIEKNAISASQLATNTLTIPNYKSGPNFRISFFAKSPASSLGDADSFQVEWVTGIDVHVNEARYNEICQFDGIAFAIRCVGESWSENVLNFVGLPAGAVNEIIEPVQSSREARWTKRYGMALMFLVMALAACMAYFIFAALAHRAVANQLTQFFANGRAPNTIAFVGGTAYVISQSDAGAEWDRQVALRLKASDRPIITSVDELQRHVENILDAHDIDFFTIRFLNVEEPELILVSKPGESEETQRARVAEVTRYLQSPLPFAKGLHIREVSLGDVAQAASEKLKSIPVTFTKIASDRYVTFFVTGYISDYALAGLTKLIKNFSGDWGRRKIRFSLVLKTVWLDGKSRQIGQDGYVLVNPSHWYFENAIQGN